MTSSNCHAAEGQASPSIDPGSPPRNLSRRPARTPLLKRFSDVIEGNMQRAFYKAGLFVGRTPCRSMAVALLVVIMLGSGMWNFTQESRGDKLWVPQDSEAQQDKDYVDATFGVPARSEQVLVKPKVGNNVLTPQFLSELLELHLDFMAINVTVDGTRYTYLDNLCVKEGTVCSMVSILDLWNYDRAALAADTTQEAILDVVNQVDPKTITGRNMSLTFVLGGIQRDDNGRITGAEIASMSYQVRDDYRQLDGGDYVNPPAEAWEEQFLDLVLQRSFTYLDPAVIATRSFSDEFGAAIGGDLTLLTVGYLVIIVYAYVMLGRFDRVRSRGLLSLGLIATVGLSIVASYGLASWLDIFYSPVHSLAPFILLGLGIDDAFVIAHAYASEKPPKAGTGPGGKDLNVADAVAERFARALAHAGVSITVTSITDVVAFSLGSTTALPALASFCQYAALGILAVYLLQIFFFGAIFVLDARRIERQRVDCCPCCTPLCAPRQRRGRGQDDVDVDEDEEAPTPAAVGQHEQALEQRRQASNDGSTGASVQVLPDGNGADKKRGRDQAKRSGDEITKRASRRAMVVATEEYPSYLSKIFYTTYGPFLLRPPVRWTVIVATITLIALSIAAATSLETEFDETSFLPDDSYLQRWNDWREQYFASDPVSSPLDVYVRPTSYRATKSQLLNLYNAVRANQYIESSSTDFWYVDFLDWLPSSSYSSSLGSDGLPATDADLTAAAAAFLAAEGSRFEDDVVISGSSIVASRFEARFQGLTTSSTKVDAMRSIRSTVDNNDGGQLGVFAYSFLFIEFEQYALIEDELFQNVAISLAAVTLIVFVLVSHPLTAVTVSFCVAGALCLVLGVMYVWGVAVDAVATINLVLALGLAVDFSAHIGHAFMLASGSTRDLRVREALRDLGGSVINGGISTLLAVLLLSASKSYVFRIFFKLFLAIVLGGLWMGLVFLPSVLSLIGPPPFEVSSNSHQQRSGSCGVDEIELSAVKCKVAPSPIGVDPCADADDAKAAPPTSTTAEV